MGHDTPVLLTLMAIAAMILAITVAPWVVGALAS